MCERKNEVKNKGLKIIPREYDKLNRALQNTKCKKQNTNKHLLGLT